MKNFLTGLEVSKETKKVLEKLENNQYVSYEIVKELPEIRQAYTCINNSVQTFRLNDRKDIQEKIVRDIEKRGSVSIENDEEFTGEIRKEKRIDIVIGLPAAGKSSTIVIPLSREFKSRVIDSDEIKKLLPEYNNGWGASVVHEESKKINREVLVNALRNGENIIYPIVGSKLEDLEENIRDLKTIGYDVYVHYNELSMNKALGRMIKRYLEEGRFLDPQITYNYGDAVGKVYEEIKRGGKIDGYSKFNNDVKRGERPRLIETNCRGRLWEEVYSNNIRDDGRYGHNDGRSNKTSGQGKTAGERRSIEEIRKDLLKHKIRPTKLLVNNIIKLENMMNQRMTIKELNSLYKNKSNNKDVMDVINKIGIECAKQQKAEKYDILER